MLPAWRAAALLDTHMPTLTVLYLMCTWLYLCGFEALLCRWVIALVELCGPAEVMLCTFMIQADSISACFGLFLNVFKLFYACSSILSTSQKASLQDMMSTWSCTSLRWKANLRWHLCSDIKERIKMLWNLSDVKSVIMQKKCWLNSGIIIILV